MPPAFDRATAANNCSNRFTWGIEMTCENLSARDTVRGISAEPTDRLYTLSSPARFDQK